ncbi:MAG: OmpH family outer membrane protein [Pseudohongiellaceae bacterium]
MMKKIVVIAALLMFSQSLFAQDGPVIGVVNLEQALFNTEVAQELEADIREEMGDDEARLEQLNAELQEIIQRAQRDESILSESEMRRLNADAQDKQVQLRVVAERLQEAWEERQQEFVDGMRQNLGRAIEEVVQEGGYDLVLNAEQVAYFNNAYNITAEVTARLNELTQ